MMTFKVPQKEDLPFTLNTSIGKTMIFKEIKEINGEEVLYMDCICEPETNIHMHAHYFQDELLTVKSGILAYRIKNDKEKYLVEGESFLFPKGCHHSFRNAGEDKLHIEAVVTPALNTLFFCTTVTKSLENGQADKPEIFDAAFIFLKYKKEHVASDVNWFTYNIAMPIIYSIGKLLGKYQKFNTSPEPL